MFDREGRSRFLPILLGSLMLIMAILFLAGWLIAQQTHRHPPMTFATPTSGSIALTGYAKRETGGHPLPAIVHHWKPSARGLLDVDLVEATVTAQYAKQFGNGTLEVTGEYGQVKGLPFKHGAECNVSKLILGSRLATVYGCTIGTLVVLRTVHDLNVTHSDIAVVKLEYPLPPRHYYQFDRDIVPPLVFDAVPPGWKPPTSGLAIALDGPREASIRDNTLLEGGP